MSRLKRCNHLECALLLYQKDWQPIIYHALMGLGDHRYALYLLAEQHQIRIGFEWEWDYKDKCEALRQRLRILLESEHDEANPQLPALSEMVFSHRVRRYSEAPNGAVRYLKSLSSLDPHDLCEHYGWERLTTPFDKKREDARSTLESAGWRRSRSRFGFGLLTYDHAQHPEDQILVGEYGRVAWWHYKNRHPVESDTNGLAKFLKTRFSKKEPHTKSVRNR